MYLSHSHSTFFSFSCHILSFFPPSSQTITQNHRMQKSVSIHLKTHSPDACWEFTVYFSFFFFCLSSGAARRRNISGVSVCRCELNWRHELLFFYLIFRCTQIKRFASMESTSFNYFFSVMCRKSLRYWNERRCERRGLKVRLSIQMSFSDTYSFHFHRRISTFFRFLFAKEFLDNLINVLVLYFFLTYFFSTLYFLYLKFSFIEPDWIFSQIYFYYIFLYFMQTFSFSFSAPRFSFSIQSRSIHFFFYFNFIFVSSTVMFFQYPVTK